MNTVKELFLSKERPKPLGTEAVQLLVWVVFVFGVAVIFQFGDYMIPFWMTVGYLLSSAADHIWYHFRPPKTRYTNP